MGLESLLLYAFSSTKSLNLCFFVRLSAAYWRTQRARVYRANGLQILTGEIHAPRGLPLSSPFGTKTFVYDDLLLP